MTDIKPGDTVRFNDGITDYTMRVDEVCPSGCMYLQIGDDRTTSRHANRAEVTKVEGDTPDEGNWEDALMESAAQPTAGQVAQLTDTLAERDRLQQYVQDLQETLDRVQREHQSFLDLLVRKFRQRATEADLCTEAQRFIENDLGLSWQRAAPAATVTVELSLRVSPDDQFYIDHLDGRDEFDYADMAGYLYQLDQVDLETALEDSRAGARVTYDKED
jgi:hypothetical protein